MSRLTLFFLFLGFTTLVSPNVFAAGPRLVVSPETWELGNVYQWDSPTTEITIKNSGDKPLVIEDVKSSCGCAAAVLSEKTIKPGAAGRLKMSYDPFGANPGPIHREIVLVTNDPASPRKSILLSGRVLGNKAAIGYIDPDYIDIGVVAPYETKFFTLSIGNKGNIDLNLDGIELPKGCFIDSGTPVKVTPKGLTSVRIGYRPPLSSGPINEELTVKPSDKGLKSMKLKVVGYVSESARGSDALIITPPAFKVSPDAPDYSVEVAVKNGGKGRVLVEGAESSLNGDEPRVTNRELKPGESGRISLSLKTRDLKPDTRGYLYIRVAIPIEVDTGKK